jgi:hypothetical protein
MQFYRLSSLVIFFLCFTLSFTAVSQNLKVTDTIRITRYITELGDGQYDVQVTITSSGSISGFTKFQEQVPLTARVDVIGNGGASTTFDGGPLKFIWTSYPKGKAVQLHYVMTLPDKPDKNYKGVLTFLSREVVNTFSVKPEDVYYTGQKKVRLIPK